MLNTLVNKFSGYMGSLWAYTSQRFRSFRNATPPIDFFVSQNDLLNLKREGHSSSVMSSLQRASKNSTLSSVNPLEVAWI